MRNKNHKTVQETQTAFAFAVLLQNILILLVIGGVVWVLHSTVSEPSALNAILRGGMFP
jgi:hypothetical protein